MRMDTMKRAYKSALATAACLAVLPAAAPTRAAVELVSKSFLGAQLPPDGRSEAPVVNRSGRYVAFVSTAKDLDSVRHRVDRMDYRDVFVTDRVTGHTEHVSIGLGGSEANGNSPGLSTVIQLGITADGCLIAFSSEASNLVEGDEDGAEDVFLYHRCESPPRTEVIGPGITPDISADGRLVVYANEGTIWMFDRNANEARPVSEGLGDGTARTPSISGDGTLVAFAFLGNGPQQIYVRDPWSDGEAEMASRSTSGAAGNGDSYRPDLNEDGLVVVFKSEATNLVAADTNGAPDTFIRDRGSQTTVLASVDRFGNHTKTGQWSAFGSVSDDGRFVAFPSLDDTLDATGTDRNRESDAFLHDRDRDGNGIPDEPGVDQTDTLRMSIELPFEKSDGGVPENPPGLSGNGRFVAFASLSSKLVPDDTNGNFDVFVACNPLNPPCPPECLGDEQCDDGEVCLPDSNTCVSPTPSDTPTETATPTATPTTTSTPCSDDCPPGSSCVNGVCVPNTPTATATATQKDGGGGGGCSCEILPGAKPDRSAAGLALLIPAVLLRLRRRASRR